jgi:hypothetical protein
MRKITVLLIILGTLLVAFEAKAQEYAEVRGTNANLEKFDLANTGWELAGGYDFGWLRTELVVGEHKHLGDATSAIYTMTYVEHTMGNWTPSVGVGGGYSFNPGRPIIHLSAQVAYEITQEWSVTMGYTHRYYTGPFGEDGFTTIGLRRTF